LDLVAQQFSDQWPNELNSKNQRTPLRRLLLTRKVMLDLLVHLLNYQLLSISYHIKNPLQFLRKTKKLAYKLFHIDDYDNNCLT
jgi:hypothetical protein